MAHFERPVVTKDSHTGFDKLRAVQGKNHIWFCGAYALPGIPLLENAVNSGLWVAEAIGAVKRPWSIPPYAGGVVD